MALSLQDHSYAQHTFHTWEVFVQKVNLPKLDLDTRLELTVGGGPEPRCNLGAWDAIPEGRNPTTIERLK